MEDCQSLKLASTSTSSSELEVQLDGSGYDGRQLGKRLAASYVNFYYASSSSGANDDNDYRRTAIIVPSFDCEEGILLFLFVEHSIYIYIIYLILSIHHSFYQIKQQ